MDPRPRPLCLSVVQRAPLARGAAALAGLALTFLASCQPASERAEGRDSRLASTGPLTIPAAGHPGEGVVDWGHGISFVDHGDWIRLADAIDFEDGCRYGRLVANLATPNAANHVEVRLDAADGPKIGDLVTAATGTGFDTYQEQSTPLARAVGTHSVYLRFDGAANQAAKTNGWGFGIGNFVSFRLEPASASCGPVTFAVRPPLEIGINEPARRFVASPAASLSVAGATTAAASVAWKTATASGAATVTGSSFTASVPLAAGQNVVQLRATAGTEQAMDFVVATRTTATTLTADASLSRRTIATGASATIRVAIPLQATGATIGSVGLLRRTAAGALESVATLVDDGGAASGDATAGDGTFTAQVAITEAAPRQVPLFAKVTLSTGGTDTLAVGSLEAVTPPSAAAYDRGLQILQELTALVASKATLPDIDAFEAVATAALADPAVETVHLPYGARALTVVFKAGFSGLVSRPAPGTRAGVEVGNRKNLLIKMFNGDLNPQEIDQVKTLWQAQNSSQVSIEGPLVDEAVTIEKLRTMTDYGIIALASHGDRYFRKTDGTVTLFETLTPEDAAVTPVSGLLVYTMQPAQNTPYLAEIAAGELLPTGLGVLAFTEKFIQNLPGTFPNSFVYFGACQSASTDAFWNAFRSKGAAGYFGYTLYVPTKAAATIGGNLFSCLITGKHPTNGAPKTLSDCMTGLAASPASSFTYNGTTYTCAAAKLKDQNNWQLLKEARGGLMALPANESAALTDAKLFQKAYHGNCGLADYFKGSSRGGPITGITPLAQGDVFIGVCPAGKTWNASTGTCVGGVLCGGSPLPADEGSSHTATVNTSCPANAQSIGYTKRYECCGGTWIDVSTSWSNCGSCGTQLPPSTVKGCSWEDLVCGTSHQCVGGVPVQQLSCWQFVPG